MNYSNKQIENFISLVESGDITEYNLPEDLYFAIANYLKKGLYKGFGATLETVSEKDFELLKALRENIYMFSAAKEYQFTKEMRSLIFDENGNKRTSEEFNKVGRETFDLWNDDWGKTEYNTTVGQSMAAVKWNEIEKNKDVMPFLRYSAIIDANTSDICAPLDGLVAKVDDPIWNSVAPLNHFNCRCVLLQEDDLGDTVLTPSDDKNNIVDGVEEKMQDLFKSNPGKTMEVFDSKHPYFQEITVEDKPYAQRNFDLPIPEKD